MMEKQRFIYKISKPCIYIFDTNKGVDIGNAHIVIYGSSDKYIEEAQNIVNSLNCFQDLNRLIIKNRQKAKVGVKPFYEILTKYGVK